MRMALLLFFCLFLLVIPSGISPVQPQLANRSNPYLSNASDQEVLLGSPSEVLSQSLSSTWKRNVSFCEQTGVICSVTTQRVVSLNVRSMGLQDTENNVYEGFLAFYEKSMSALAGKSVQFGLVGLSFWAIGWRSLGEELPKNGPIFFGLSLAKSRRGISLLLMMSNAIPSNVAALTVNNTEIISSAGENIPVGDKLPPSCHDVAECGDCVPCVPKGQGFLCCDES